MTDPTTPARGGRVLPLALLVLGLAAGVGWAVGKWRRGGGDPPDPPAPVGPVADRRGELAYQTYCASCHGPDGRGDGPSAAALRPPPRDFAARPWRFEVTRESIRRVILDGIPGTAMASSRAALAPADVDPLVEYTYRLATSRPPVPHEPSEDERLARDAGFTDMRGTDPPPLAVSDAAGKEVTLSGLKGRLVLVHFWGVNCVHCLKEMPALKRLEADLGGRGLTVLHVCGEEDDLAAAQAAAERAAPGVRVYADGSGLAAARFEAHALPTVWLVGPEGRAVGRAQGARDWSAPAIRQLVEHHLPPGP